MRWKPRRIIDQSWSLSSVLVVLDTVFPGPPEPDEGGFLPPFPKTLFTIFVKGTMAILANQGVAETLTTSLTGKRAFVTAYAVANL